MNLHLPIINTRSSIARKFFKLQTHALQDALQAISTNQDTSLAAFPWQAPWKSPNRKYSGIREIPLGKIVGTLSKNSSFDHKFRPLKKYLRERWINIYLAFKKDGLTPIVVHKVGEIYYVEDGHYRVSAALSLGRKSIRAKVWEYPVDKAQTAVSQFEQCCAERNSAYAA